MLKIKTTIYLESPFWVALFERVDQKGYQAKRHIFGAEPSDAEIYQFILKHFETLEFGKPQEFKLSIKRMNPKRQQRIVRKEMENVKKTQAPSTHAQDYMREELEKNKKERQKKNREQVEAHKERLFELKVDKRKQKKKGR